MLNKFRIADNQCCDEPANCETQMAKDTCEVWPNMMSCYITEVNRGLGGLIQCYIAGIQCFCNTLETVADELCDRKHYITHPKDPCDKEITDAKADFCQTFKETFNPLFHKLETETEKVGQKYGKSAQAQVIGAYTKFWEEKASKDANDMIESIPKFVDEYAKKILTDKESKESEAQSHQGINQELENTRKELVEEAKSELKEFKKVLIDEFKSEIAALKKLQK